MPNYNDGINFLKLIPKIYSYLSIEDEIIFIDDGSEDGSYEKITELVSNEKLLQVRVYQNEKNIGVVATENIGASLAKGEYLYFAASDDDISPHFFANSINALLNNPKAGVCSTASYLEYPDKIKIKLPIKGPSKKQIFLTAEQCQKYLISNENWISGNSCIYRRKYFIDEGGFREELEGFCDVLLTLLIPIKYGAVFVPRVLTNFRLSKNSYASRHYKYENIQLTMKIIESVKVILEEQCGEEVANHWWVRNRTQILTSAILKECINFFTFTNKVPLRLLITDVFYLVKKSFFNKYFYFYVMKVLTLRRMRLENYAINKIFFYKKGNQEWTI